MAPRFTPGKPRAQKIRGSWYVFVPQVVFGDEASGSYHGPFPCWQIAVAAAVAIAGAVLLNVTAINSAPMQMRVVN